jgi:ADP-ribose pyrophosphatase
VPQGAAGADDHLIERRLFGEPVFDGRLLHVRRDTVELPGGDHATREYIVHPGAVMVVPVLDDGRLVMERQYRYPLGCVMLEFPAGKRDPLESAARCAARELAEETGYAAAEWARAGVIHNACSYSTEAIEIWFARGLRTGSRQLDHGEFIDLIVLTEGELDRLAQAGELTDVKTLAGLQWLQKWRSGDWTLDWRPQASWTTADPPA